MKPVYRAYLRVGTNDYRIFPRSKKTSVFKTIAAAEKALIRKAAPFKQDTFGHIYDNSGNLAFTIAL